MAEMDQARIGHRKVATTRRRVMQGLPALGAAALLPGAAAAQGAPRPIRWIVGFPPGSGTDVGARIIAEVASRNLGQPIVVENRPGASGSLAPAAARTFPADGLTIFTLEMGAYSLVPHFLPGISYDAARDFRMVSILLSIPMVLMVPSSLGVSTAAEFVALARSRAPNTMQFGSSGAGSITHVTMAAFLREVGVTMEHVPYRGTNFTVADLAADRIAAAFTDANTPTPFMQAGKLRMLAVAAPERLAAQPNVPTIREAGFSMDMPYWQGVAVLRGTADATVERLNDALNRAAADPQVGVRLREIGMEPWPRMTAQAADDFARTGDVAVRDKLRELGLATQ
ncbi:Bug family tripartite tricarboxylate transporter substrate binding protein [Roseococcus sp. DSY-14]|uniref:Bug family tripartite tricarboxylate transporter substrate binding protein n=1 Tax=Roseococcus sp. DSY-14 TaxID=3369650 RepID=UPI00387B25B3